MYWNLVLVAVWKYTPPMCEAEPTPAVPAEPLSGLAASQAMSSFRFFAGLPALATTNSGLLAISASGCKSLSKSYCSG